MPARANDDVSASIAARFLWASPPSIVCTDTATSSAASVESSHGWSASVTRATRRVPAGSIEPS